MTFLRRLLPTHGISSLLVYTAVFACNDELCQIYLRTSPLVAYQRMVARARAEEAAIPLSYFQRMHQARQNNVRLTALRISHYIVWVSSGK